MAKSVHFMGLRGFGVILARCKPHVNPLEPLAHDTRIIRQENKKEKSVERESRCRGVRNSAFLSPMGKPKFEEIGYKTQNERTFPQTKLAVHFARTNPQLKNLENGEMTRQIVAKVTVRDESSCLRQKCLKKSNF